MHIAITGATGNIGSALIRRLLSTGEHTVVGLARRVPTDDGPVTWRAADLTADDSLPVLREVFGEADAVVHLAWGFQPSHRLNHLAELGIGGTRRVVTAAAQTDVPHLVHMSSIGAYSPHPDNTPVDESWPVEGVPTSRYSRHKSAAEQVLDGHEGSGRAPVVTRIRPALVGRRAAASELLRYTMPALVPATAVDLLPVLPMDRRLRTQMVHTDDVADAVARVLEQRAAGAFNLAADPPLTPARIAAVLGARHVHVPSTVLRTMVAVSWHLRLQPVDTGWIDMAFALPLLDARRARHELGWRARHSGLEVLGEVVAGMRDRDHGHTAVTRRRTVPGALSDAVRRGPVAVRRRP